MKKKILSLLLCLTLCIPLALASCTVPDLWPQEEEKEKTFFDEISCLWENKDSYDSASSFVTVGTVASSNEKFVYTVGLDYSDESIGLIVDKTHYRVYNVASGALIFEDSLLFDIKSLSYTSESKSIDVTLLDKMICVKKTSTETGEETAYFFDENGKELLKTSDTALTKIDENRIILNHKLYVLENGELKMKKDLNDISPAFYTIITQLACFGDRYVYLDKGTSTIYVFDENYSFLYKKALKQTQGATFADEQYKYFTLANGNVLFQTTYSVGNYSVELEPYTYDYISGGKCFKLDSYLLDIRTGNYKEIELSYILSTVLPVEGSSTNISLPYGAQNIGIGQRIDAKKLVNTDGAHFASFLLYNNGGVSGLPSVDGSANLTVISENRFIVENDFFVKVYNENATLIGTLDSYEYCNEKFIVTGKEILSHNLEVVYSLSDNNAAVLDVTSDSIFVVAYDKEAGISTTYLITGSGEPKAISNDVSLFVYDSFFVAEEEKDGASKLVIYKTNGDVIGEFAIDEHSGVEFCREYDGYAVIETKNIEGKTMYITVFKTEKA